VRFGTSQRYHIYVCVKYSMIDERERRLDEREARIEVREQRLDDRERRLDERERRVAARERRDELVAEVITVSDDEDQRRREWTAGFDEREARSERRLAEEQLLATRGLRDDSMGEPCILQREWPHVTRRVSVVTSDGALYVRLHSFITTVDDLKTMLEGIVGIPKACQRIDVQRDGRRSCLDNPAAGLHYCGVAEAATLHLTDLVPHRTFPLYIKSLTGETHFVNAAGHMLIERLQFLVWLHPKLSTPLDLQRLIYRGRQLEAGRTVAECGLSAGATVHLVLRLRGDIGVWGAAENGPGAAVLRGMEPPTPAACAEVRASLLVGPLAAANPPTPAAIAEPLLDAQQCGALSHAADDAIEAAANASGEVDDTSIALDDGAVKVLLRRTPGLEGAATDWQVEFASHAITAHVGAAALAGLKSALGAAAHRFVVRRVDAGAGVEAIPFHTDYARRTLQVPLNAPLVASGDGSGYEGGEVVYAVGGGFLKLPRRRGHGVVHDGTVPHGVTPLLRGRRYGLCVLHDHNHLE
jgi:hypothetical protein